MRGQVSEFSVSTNQGFIIGDDGRQYPFAGNHWHDARAPMAGDVIEFSVDAQGHAVHIQTSLQLQSTLNLTKPADTINPYQAPTQMGNLVTTQGVNPLWVEEENYGFFDWVKKCLRNYANFSGRARRKEYWFFYLGSMLITVLGLIIDSVLGLETPIFYGLAGLGLFIPGLAAGVRRLHDIGKSGWWMLIALVPLIGGILLLVWYATDTKPETNQWGMPARRV